MSERFDIVELWSAQERRWRRLAGKAWRVVEAQHIVSTRRLVDSHEEQEILEELIDSAKPPLPKGPQFRGLHYLLATPFRHPPLRHGSRFGTRAEPSIWYGSARVRTAFAETAYYRLLFLEGTSAELDPVSVELSAFRVAWRTSRGVDLTLAPFDDHRRAIASPNDYTATQAVGSALRADGVAVFRYPSARDIAGGTNIGLFTPSAFVGRAPETPETWHCVASRSGVEMVKRDFFEQRTLTFPRGDFEVAGQLPSPAARACCRLSS